MSKRSSLSPFAVLAALGLATPLAAQERSTVSGTELEAAVAARPVPSRPATPGVRVIGTPASDRAAVQRSMAQSQNDERDLAGGAVTITYTVLLIAVLVLIILLIA